MLRRFTAWLGRNASARPERSAVVEEVEPRILYSADLNPALWAGDAAAQSSAIVGTLNPGPQTTAPAAAAEQQQRRHEIVFVDAAVPDARTLIDALLAQRDANADIEIVQISAGADGLKQIGEVLAGECDVNAIHIVSQGGPGRLQLGTGTVDAGTLSAQGDMLAAWRLALSDDADILLCASDVGDGAIGQAFIAQLAQRTGAEVVVAAQEPTSLQQAIVFVDTQVVNYQHLVDDLSEQRASGAAIEVVLLDAGRDGIAQISAYLQGRQGIDALQIYSHGVDGAVELGSAWLNAFSLEARAGEISQWRNALSADADILLYGCDVAADGQGQGFVDRLAEITGADVAASRDATGSAARGANWSLEYARGRVEAVNALSTAVQQSFTELLAITVGNTSSADTTNAGALSLTWSHTVASGSNGILIVEVASKARITAVTSVTYGGVALTFLGASQYSGGDDTRAEMWTLKAPATGIANIVVTTNASSAFAAGATNFYGVNQTTPTGSVAAASNNDSTPSVTVTSAAGELVIDTLAVRAAANGTGSVGAGQTQSFQRSTGGGGSDQYASGSSEAGAASVTMSWTLGGNKEHAIVAVALKPTLAGITVTPTTGLLTTEAAGTASFDVVLTGAPTANVTIAVSSSDTSEGTVSTSLLTFTTADWSTPQTVTVTGVNDALADGYQPYSIVLGAAASSDANYNNVDPTDVQVANADNDINYGLITVDTSADTADGDTSSLAALAANRGADGSISLREAITAANNTANGAGGADRIHFNIAGAGVHTINVASALPTINQALIIDGSSDPDYAGTPVVRIDGAAAGFSGISIGAGGGGSTIQGLMITGFTVDGINVASGANNVTIADNWIGTAGTGTSGHGNANVGNSDDGIDIAGSNALILRNVITNNNDEGINIVGSGVTGHVIQGNTIGLDPDGSTSVNGNNDVGIAIISGTGNTIGGTTAAARNVIAKNNEGLEINTSDNVVQGNYIGTDVTGALNRGNRVGSGVQLQGSSTNNQVGGTAPGAGNLIAYNAGNGVEVVNGSGDLILGNAIHSNTLLGINLGTAGVTVNDANDVDGGANNLQNFPVLSSVALEGAHVVIAGTLNSEANKTYRIEFFANTANDNEGQRYLGYTTVTTPAGSPYTVSFTATLTATVTAGEYITATATDPSNNTSEFSAQVAAASGMGIWANNNTTPVFAQWNGSGFGSTANSQTTGEWAQLRIVEAPTRTEIIAVGVDTAGIINGQIWNGSAWAAFSFNDLVDLSTTGFKGFQLAYEQQSGDALLVWDNGSTGTASLSYRTWNGTSWSAAQTITTPVSGEAVQLSLSADPNSDSMVLAVSGTPAANDYALVWNGSSWGNAVTLDTTTGADRTEIQVAYEAHSGQAVVVYDADGSTNAINYRTWDGTSWSAQQSLPAPAGIGAGSDANFSVMASDPNSDRLALAVITDSSEIWISVWDGTAWGTQVAATTTAAIITAPSVGLAFEHDSGDLLAAYGKSGSNTVFYRTWTSAGGWTAEATGPNVGGVPNSVLLYADPNSNRIMLGVHDNQQDVNFVEWTGSAWNAVSGDMTSNTGTSGGFEPLGFVWYDNNRTPVIGTTGLSMAENGTLAGSVASSDADGDTRSYSIVGGADQAKFTIDSGTGALSFVSAPDYESPTDAGANNVYDVIVQVADGKGGTDSGAIAVTVTNANDAPVATNLSAAETYTEDTPLNLTDIVISDVDSASVTATLTLSNAAAGSLNTGTSGAVTSTYNAGTGVWTASGAIANVNALLAGLTFTPAANFNSNFTISTSVSDGVAAPVTGSKVMTGTAVNDAPSASNLSAAETFTEDTALNLTDIVISDVDSANVRAVLTLSNTAAGSLNTGTSGAVTSTYNAGTGVWIANGAVADVNALLAGLTFTPAANFNSNFTITTSIDDGVASPVTGSKAMTGTPVNDAPSATNLSTAETYTEDTALNLVDIVISDVDSANVTATLTLSNTAAGSLNTGTSGAVTSTFNAGTGVWTASGAIADVNSLLAGLTFSPAANFNSSFTIATSVSDGVAAPVTGNKAMTGTPVNDAPSASNLSAAETYTEDTALNLTDIVISDVDSASVTATLTLSSAAAGSLNTGTSGAVTSTYNAGTGVWMASGAIADVNTLLAGLSFTPAANFNSNFTISTSVSDGVAAPVTSSKAMTGTAVNDAPVVGTTGSTLAYTENGAATAVDAALTLSDVDNPNLSSATITISAGFASAEDTLGFTDQSGITGSWNSGTGVLTLTGSASVANYQTALRSISYVNSSDNPNTTTRTVSFVVNDGSANSNTGTRNIGITAVNDAPVITSNAGGPSASVSIAENGTAVTTVASSDADGGTPTYSILGGGDGAKFSVNASTGVLAFVTAPDYENPSDLGADNVYNLTLQVSDGGGGTDTQAIAVTVTDVADGIRVTPISVAPIGAETRVNTNTGDIQTINPNVAQAIATDAAGNFVVVWSSNLQDGDSYGIYAQRYSADGTAQGAEFRVNTTTAYNQNTAVVAMDAAGNFVVAWASDQQDGNGYGISAQRYNAAGVAQGSEFLVNSTTALSQTTPSVAMSAGGAFVITWTGGGQDPDASSGIYAQRFDASGVAQGGEFRVNTYTTNTQQLTSVGMDAAGNFVVIWASLNQDDGASYGVYGQRYNAAGVAQGAEFRVNTTIADSQLYHDVAMLADGRFAVVFQSRGAGPSYEVYVQRYAADGSALGGEFRVNTTTVTTYQPIPSISADASGNLTVVWRSPADGSGDGVIGRRLDWSGTPLGAEFQVNSTAAGDQGYPEVVSQPGGGFIVAWSGNGPGDADGVFFQRYGLTTTEAGGTATFSVVLEAAPTGDVVIPISVPDGTEGSVVVGSLTFTTANWNIAQVVTVTGVQDYSNDGSVLYTVVLGSATSSDPNFNGLNPADVSVTNLEVPNVAPVNSVPGNQSTDEDTVLAFSTANGNAISISDADAGSGIVNVLLAATNGTITLNGTAGLSFVSGDGSGDALLNFTGTIAGINAALNGLVFAPTAGFSGAASLQIVTGDMGNSGTGGSLADSDTVSITVNPVNDAPAASNLSAGEIYTEDTPLNLTDIVISDVDSASVTATLTLSNTAAGSLNTGTAGAVTSTYNAGTGVWTASGAIADVNALLAGLTFTPAANFNSNFTIATTVSDGVAAPVTGNKAVTGTAVNDAPSATNLSAAETYTEDTVLNLTDIVISDVDSANVTATLTVSNTAAGGLNTGTSGAVTSTYNAGTGVWTASGAIADVNALLAGLTFTPAANFNSNFTIATSVSDGVAAPVTGSKAMTGTAVNDAPSATNLGAPETYTEDTALNLTDIVISDVDSANVTATLTLSNTAAGSLNTGTAGAVTSTYNAGTGVWTASGAIADVNALLAGLTFTPAANFNSNFTIATTVSDGVAAPVTGNKAVTGTAVNDAPSATNLSAAETYTEDTALNLTDIVISDVDSASVTATLTLSNTAAGSLNTGTSGAVTSTYNAGTGVWTASGAIADVNTLLAGLTFTPAANFNSDFTIATSVSDGVAAPVTGSKAMTGTAVNDVPSATNLSAAETYTEDTALNLADIVISDVDSANVTATLTLSNTAAGSLNTGTSGAVTSTYNAGTGVWSASGAIGDVNALLAGLTFTPAADFNSNFTIATSVSDGVAAPITGSKAMTGTPVNDAPSATNLSAVETYTEDTVLNLTDIVISDVDSANVTATLTLSNTAAGGLNTGTSGAVTSTYNAGTGVWTASGAIADVNALLAGLTFTPAANFNSDFTIATSVSDGVAAPVTGSKAMTGTAVNDAPSATNLSAAETYTEDTALNLTDIVVSDVDSANVTATLTLSNTAAGSLNTGTSGAVTSTYNAGTGVWTASGAIADVNTLLAGLTFTPAANFNSNFTISTSVSDGVAAPVTGSKAMTGTAVNDAPSASNLSAGETYTEDTALNLADIVISDVDSANVTATLTLSNTAAGGLNTGTSGAVTSTYNAGTGVWTASGAIADVNALLAGLTFTPAANFNSDFTIATSVSDGVAAPVTGSKAMTGTPVNDAPSATNLSAAETYTEDTALNLTDIVVSDVDSANVTATLTLSNTAAGSLGTGTSGAVTSTYNAGTGVWTASGAIADVNALLAALTFTPAANFNSNFTIATSVSDGVAAPVTGSKAMTGTAVNDAPSATNLSAAETYTEDTALNLTDIVISDVDSANVTATLTLSNTAAGSLNTGTSGAVTSTYNAGTGVWTASGAIADVNTLLAALTFTPAANFNSNFTIATSVSDGVAAPVTGSKAMTGIAVNDAPSATNLSAGETYSEDTALNLTDIVISDVDSANVTATLTLSNTAAGSLNTGTSGAVTSTYNAGTGVWSASGAVADVNALLAGLTFTPAANFNSNFTIATGVSDGVAAPVTGSKAMTGTAVNDAPSASNLSAAETYTEDTALNLTDIVVSDVDSANVTATLTLSNTTAGSLNTGTSGAVTSTYNAGTGVWTASGAIADVNALLAALTFTPAANFNSNFTIATSVSDGVAAPVTGSKAMTGTPVNDAPTATNLSAAETYTEDTALDLTDIVISDVDSANVTATLTLSNTTAGSLNTGTSGAVTSTYNAGTGVWMASGGIADVNALLAALTFTPAANFNSNFTIAASVSDGVAPSVTGSKAMTGMAVNDAPTLGNGVLAAVAEDSANPAGQSVATVFAGQFADVDAGASLSGIAVVGNSANAGTQGSWQYSTDGGTYWHAIGAVADGAGALALSSATLIRFLPVADYHGTPPALTVRGLDDSYAGAYSASGASETRVTIDTSSNGGATPIAAVTSAVSTSVSPVNDAPVTSPVALVPIAEDGGARLITQAELLANASDVDGPSLTATGLAISAGSGSLVDNGNGTWTYTPATNDDTAVSFSYNVTDGTASVAGSATLDITPVNDAPTTTPVTLVPIAEDSGARLITQAELLVNASDVDGPGLTATGLTISAGNGSLTDNGNGTWTYTPATNDDTAVSFSYIVTDGTASAAGSATLDIAPVNDAPTTTPVTLVPIVEDSGARLITQAELLANASDVDGPSLTATGLAISTGNGTLIDNGNGTWTYTPAANDATGVSFTYTVSDGIASVAGSASLDITPVNDAPTTTPVTLAPIAEDGGARLITQAELLSNASDIDGPGLAATGLTISAGNGVLTNNGNGTWTYMPAANDDTAASFAYTVTDGTASVAGSATLDITPVNDAPTTTPVTLVPIVEDSGARLITQAELLANANDLDGPALTVTGLVRGAGTGTLIDNGDGTWTYTPAANDDASVSFSYNVSDGSASVAGGATLDITPVNDAPTTTPVTLVPIAEDSGARLITQAELLANAADVDGPGSSAAGLAISAGSGSLTDNADGTWTYTPGANDDTAVSFSYTVTDGSASVAGNAALDLLPAGDAPVITSNGGAAGAAVGIGENGAALTTVTASDADVPAQALAYTISGGADAALFALDATSGALRFIAAPDFETPLDANADNVYDVTVQASDGALIDTQAISVTVGNVNEAPSALTPALALADENAPAGTLVATVSAVDPDAGELFSYALVNDGAGRFAIDATSGRIVVAPGALLDFEAQAGFDLLLRVTDAGGQAYEQALRVDLRDLPETAPAPAPAAPAAEPAPLSPLPTVVLSASADAAPSAPTEKSADVGRTRAPAPGPAGAQGDPSSLRLPGDADDETHRGSNAARQPLHLRVRDGAEGPLATISFDGVTFDETQPTLSVWDEAKGSIGNLLRNAALRSVLIDADTEHTQAGDERRAPDTLTEMMQDPVRVASVTFTAGFIWWLTRSGGLLTTMLMGVPAWRHVDLLPVLARPAEDEDADDEPRHGDDPGTAPAGFDDSAVAELFEPEAGGRRSASTARGVR